MSCPAFEERIANYVGGDLPAGEARAVEFHLRDCAECAQLARELEADRQWLSSRPPEIGNVDFAAMRRQLRLELSGSPKRPKWLPEMLAAAAILLIFVLTARHPRPQAPAPAQVVAAPLVAQLPATPVEIRRVPAAVGARRRQVHTAPPLTLEAAMRMYRELVPEPQPSELEQSVAPLETRIVTNDPQVTIILLPDSQGDSQ